MGCTPTTGFTVAIASTASLQNCAFHLRVQKAPTFADIRYRIRSDNVAITQAYDNSTRIGRIGYRQTPCERAVLSAADAASQSGSPSAIFVQPTPQGVSALSHQILHQPSSNRTTAKSARAGTEAAKLKIRTPAAMANRFIVNSLLPARKFHIIPGQACGKPIA